MEQLIINQSEGGKAIQKINTNFRKDSATRKTQEYCEARLQTLNSVWAKIESTNAELEQYRNQAPNNNYFKENFFSRVEELYEQTRDMIEEAFREAIERKKTSEMIQEQVKRVKKQTALVSSLDRALERIKSDLGPQTSKAYAIQKIKLLNDYWEQIAANHAEIMSMGKFKDDYFEKDVYASTEDKYQEVLIKLQEQIENVEASVGKQFEVKQSTSSSQQTTTVTTNDLNSNRNRVKLPNIEIPVFSGNYLKWQSFKDLFTELIHKNESIAGAEKLFYLKTNLVGEALELIQHLQITNENYDTAWNILSKRYDNKRTLVAAQLRTLFDQKQLNKESADGLKRLHDTTMECLQAIKNLGIETANWDSLIIFLLTDKLDKETHRLYEQTLKNPREVQSLDEFLEFLENRFQGLEAIEPSRQRMEKSEKCMRVHYSNIGKQTCPICKAGHKIYSCEKFAKFSVTQRLDSVRKAKLCTNCLTKGHNASVCKTWQSCKICNSKHHTLLHQKPSYQVRSSTYNPKSDPEKSNSNQVNSSTEVATHLAQGRIQCTVLLATALIRTIDRNGNIIELRALVDQGAQGTFITEDAAQRLKARRKRIHATVTGVGETNVATIDKGIELTIRPRFSSTFSLTVTALILKRLTKIMPPRRITPNTWKHTTNLVLADPTYDTPGRIDIILGADVFGKIILGNIVRGIPGSPIAQQTELGWVLLGEVQNSSSNETIQCFISEVDIGKELRRFWESEEVNSEQVMTSEDIACENHFKATHRRGSDGRYTVRIPFKSDPEEVEDLERSKQLALARLFQMERKFKTDKVFAAMYREFMSEYQRLGHMVPVTDNIDKGYYIPHHAVMKQDSSTTKLRVVFDASAKRINSRSLNEIMMAGPQIQQNLISILLRWRKHKMVFMADIEKMYRQIKVDVRDQSYQKILWRATSEEPIREYKLTTVTYGTTSAPFLAIRTLQQLAKDDEHIFPIASRIILHDTYVDDVVSGGSTLEEVVESSDQLIKLLRRGGFNLRKWSSNNKDLLRKIPWELREAASEIDLDNEKPIKALGIHWNTSTDNFKIQVNINMESNVRSKRDFLSEAARIFDPIGLLAPVTIKIKLLLQEVWLQGANWDDELSTEIIHKWKRIKSELPILQQCEIPRWAGYTGVNCNCELHGFSDASEKAYSAAVYLRVIHEGKISTCLLTAKTKVAPLKSRLSLPRLELCGAVLLANLLKESIKSLEIEKIPCYAWTDSTIVLSWIRENPHKWKTFVGNRVAEIQAIVDIKEWSHVCSNENPADIASRGIYPSSLRNHTLWWEGPRWLKENVIPYPIEPILRTDLEKRTILLNMVSDKNDEAFFHDLLQRYSSLGKLQRVIAYCKRFVTNLQRGKGKCNTSPLTIQEIEDALLLVVKYTQRVHFAEEIDKLSRGHPVKKGSRLVTLSPILDHQQILRVLGRTGNTDQPYNQKHPIILPYKSELTSLVIDNAHKMSLHGGNTLTLEVIRQKYWIMNGTKAVKNHIHKCVRCHRYKAQMCQQMMGMLPKARVVTSPPFSHSGVDYAGPFDLLLSKGRGNRSHKGYIALFICLTTKAIHIEVVTDLTAKAFIAAFRRFTSRRGPIAHLYSDNATNFVGASKIISELHNQDTYKLEVNQSFQEVGTQWHFIPPASPHFGGLWEAGVKSIKHHLRRVVGETKLTYEEMCTLMTEIEACLNSRPLCPLSEDPESLDVLTPGHFLTGAPLLTLPGKDQLDSNPNLLRKWEHIERMKQDFWRRWSTEYIGRLQHRPKWSRRQAEIKRGNLVLIKDDQMPPSRWSLGRVIETHPGSDGLTRVVTLQTKNGTLKRPITKLSLLPTIDNRRGESSELLMETTPRDKNSAESESEDEDMCDTHHTYADEEPRGQRRQHEEAYRSEHAKRGRYEPQTRTKKSRSHNLSPFLVFALCFCLTLGEEVRKPYTLTTLKNQEGVYFDDISEIQLYNSEWNLLIYYDLSTYWKEFIGIRKAARGLSELCEDELPGLSKDVCSATVRQIKYQILESEHINDVIYEQNENVKFRAKRAPLEIVGTIANKLFGILDQDTADKFEQQIDDIRENENILHELLKNQTSIAENTINVLKKNHQTIQLQISEVENQIETVVNYVNHSQKEIMTTQAFNSAALLIALNLVHFQQVQRSILSVITDAKHGRLNTLLLTPSQLKEQIKTIREHLPPHLKLPGDGGPKSLLSIYNSMHVKMRITRKNVLFDTRIPLLNAETYTLYKLIPIPVLHSNQHFYIQLSTTYLAVNRHRDRFSPISAEELQSCAHTTTNQLICNLKQPLYTLQSNQSRCELELLSNHKTISPLCKLRSKNPEKAWIKLNTPSTWLFIMDEETYYDIICKNAAYPVKLSGNGIIKLEQNCMINHPTLNIHSNDHLTEQRQSSFIPESQVISSHLNLSLKAYQGNESKIVIPQLITEVRSEDLEELGNAIKQQGHHINNMPKLNNHDLHHYASVYLLLCVIIAFGIYYQCRNKRARKLVVSKRPRPAPRRCLQREDATSIELPSLNIEGGECTQYI